MVATVVEVEVVELGLGNGVLERSADVAGRSHVASQRGELAIIPWLEFSMADALRGQGCRTTSQEAGRSMVAPAPMLGSRRAT